MYKKNKQTLKNFLNSSLIPTTIKADQKASQNEVDVIENEADLEITIEQWIKVCLHVDIIYFLKGNLSYNIFNLKNCD